MGHVKLGRKAGTAAALGLVLVALAALAAPDASAQGPTRRGKALPRGLELPEGTRWLTTPSPYEVSRRYPKRARQRNLKGAAIVECLSTAEGRLKDCVVLDEAPVGEGFGEAALALVASRRFGPNDRLGPQVEGYRIRIPMIWRGRGVRVEEAEQLRPGFQELPTFDPITTP